MDRRRVGWAFCLALLYWTAGCKHPVQIVTNNRVTMDSRSARAMQGLATIPVTQGAPGVGRQIALIDVDGLLVNQPMTGLYSDGENPVALFREKLDRVACSPCYAALVLRINSPGGGVTASDVMWHDLQEFKARTHLPVIACLMDVGAGGAYYLATSADHVVAHPTTVTGGIGVILNLYNLEDAMGQFNIVGTPIKAGENVDLGTPIKPQSDEARAILQRMANEFHERFRKIVIERRPQLAHASPDIFDGRVFTAQQAANAGLVDTIGYLDQAAEIAGQMGGAPGAALVLLHRPNDGARTPYDVTANVPIQSSFLPISMPGLERSRLPTFLYLWQPEPTMERLTGR
jgi:protease-4